MPRKARSPSSKGASVTMRITSSSPWPERPASSRVPPSPAPPSWARASSAAGADFFATGAGFFAGAGAAFFAGGGALAGAFFAAGAALAGGALFAAGTAFGGGAAFTDAGAFTDGGALAGGAFAGGALRRDRLGGDGCLLGTLLAGLLPLRLAFLRLLRIAHAGTLDRPEVDAQLGEPEVVLVLGGGHLLALPGRPLELHRGGGRLQGELHARGRHERVVDVVLGDDVGHAERHRDLVHQQVAGAVVELPLLGGQRPQS